jgi:hypothetical protein
VACGLAAVAIADAAAGTTTVGANAGVNGNEYSLVLTRTVADPGPGIVAFHNYGEDEHNLKLKRKGSHKVLKAGRIPPGESAEDIHLRLKPDSTYVLWCSLKDTIDHRAQGMEAELRVRKG